MKDIPATDTDGNDNGPDRIPLKVDGDALSNVICRLKKPRISPDRAVESGLKACGNADTAKTAYTKWWIHRIKLA